MATFMRVRSVEGRMLQHPDSIMLPQRHFVGWQADGAGHLKHDDECVVPDPYPDHFFRRAVQDGDLDYLGHVSDPSTEKEKMWIEKGLRAVTADHVVKRAEKAKAEADALAAAD